ncbi:carbamoyl phosphate synthase small subunit [Siminovitchia sp. FSL W7-1587]|uniref:carbamoyl phosphate synthase small subunit n=1 Tax=Siminovitchia sp. FSL W7-1587 TaxID=2954699 RepID=UPI0030D5A5D7
MEGSLLLANGERFTGQWHGKNSDSFGEIIFYTGMGRIQEFITDPANKGKIVVATFPGIVNVELDKEQFESDQIQINGLIIQDDLSIPQNADLYHELLTANIPILAGADTRAIVKKVKYAGEMPAVLTLGSSNQLFPIDQKEGRADKKKVDMILKEGKNHIVIIDFGYKKSLLKLLKKIDCKVTIVPDHATKKQIDSLNPDGLIFSGGYGNPLLWEQYLNEYKHMAVSYPVLGLGLGHQILALSFGGNVEKMRTGHRSFKEPIIDSTTQKVYMSVQNHGYAVQDKQLNKNGWRISFKNVHDGTIEGLVHEHYPIATYQFHPDLYDHPLNTIVFQTFFHHLGERKGARVYA